MSDKKTVAGLFEDERESVWQKWVVGNAPTIVAIFANFVVIVSDIRAYDVIYQLTGSLWKALAASLACAAPFIIWEIAWQYNHTSDQWRTVSLLMAGLAFGTSLVLGVADYIVTDPDNVLAAWLLGGVVITTGLHTVVGFLYYYNDPDVARRRRKAQALGMMQDQQLNAEVAKTLLENGRGILGIIGQLEREFDPEDVEKILSMLRGKKSDMPRKEMKRSQPPAMPAMATDVKREQINPTQGREQENRP